ncbi:MAG: zf-HC2 domain-containing protein [Myxococcota bacterium]|jgi:anti-sigma factor RsiW|nr:zf-HC2 domain-containing protein [Myxococcota bacterium]
MRGCNFGAVSWLTLEQYQLGELSTVERATVAGHLDACPTCLARYNAILEDDRPLRPLPRVEVVARSGWSWTPAKTWSLATALSACVLAIALGVVLRTGGKGEFQGASVGIKGGDLALTVIREREGQVVENPQRYESGDRLRLELTCAWTGRHEWDVVVFQDGKRFFPYDSPQPIVCGNRVPLPGAFRLTGMAPTTICAVLGTGLAARSQIGVVADRLPEPKVCVALDGGR